MLSANTGKRPAEHSLTNPVEKKAKHSTLVDKHIKRDGSHHSSRSHSSKSDRKTSLSQMSRHKSSSKKSSSDCKPVSKHSSRHHSAYGNTKPKSNSKSTSPDQTTHVSKDTDFKSKDHVKFRKRSAEITVKYLTPYFKSGKFASKDLFKGVARILSHAIIENMPLDVPDEKLKLKAKDLVKMIFTKIQNITSEDDVKKLIT